MYIPADMDFQYFFFNTYPGYFLEALPIAVIVAVIWYVLRYRGDKATPRSRRVWGWVFVCYVTGLLCLVLFLNVMMGLWDTLLYHRIGQFGVRLFGGEVDLGLDFFRHLSGEVLGNFLMFLPFGVLYPLAHPRAPFKKALLAGVLTVVVIEVLQPVLGRAFDLNDIVMNVLAVAVSSAVFFLIKQAVRSKRPAN